MGCRKLSYYEPQRVVEVNPFFTDDALEKNAPSEKNRVNAYRYGFNGQEKDDEVAGSGNSYTAQFWQYDSRLGRRWNVDPVIKTHESPYSTFAGNPIWFADPNGADSVVVNQNGTIAGVHQMDGDHRVFFNNGDELIFNDYEVSPQAQIENMLPSEGIRYDYAYNKDKIQLFHRIDNSEIKRYMSESGAKQMGIMSGTVDLIQEGMRYLDGAAAGNGQFDFFPVLHREYGNPSDDVGRTRMIVPEDQGGFYLFGNTSENSKRIYNLYDAGNFLTGKAYQTAGFTWPELKIGSEGNEYSRFNLGDTQADQDALWNGFNYNLEW